MEAAIQDFTHKCFWNMNLKHLYCRQNGMLEMIALETSYKSKAAATKIHIADIHNLERTFWTHGKDSVHDLVYDND